MQINFLEIKERKKDKMQLKMLVNLSMISLLKQHLWYFINADRLINYLLLNTKKE